MITVTAAILVRHGKVFIAMRKAGDRLAGKWEFPGGKVEPGESAEECLVREMEEEFGIEVRVGSFLGENVYHYESGSVRLLAFEAHWTGGAMIPAVHDAIRWVAIEDLESYDFAPADRVFAGKLASGEWLG